MLVIDTPLRDVKLVKPTRHGDERGWFAEVFNARDFAAAGLPDRFVQDNQSFSQQGVLRGLHYQLSEPQGKLVRALSGHIWDVAVDLRPGSPDYGKWAAFDLTEDAPEYLWIPEGFAHGFVVLSQAANVLYKTTRFYYPAGERCVRWDDPTLAIPWPLESVGVPTVSAKDAAGVLFTEAELPSPYMHTATNSRRPLELRRTMPPKQSRILLTGASGQIGGELLPLLARFGEVVAPPRQQLDLSNTDAVRAFVRETRPSWIINAAAYTAVDKAESEPEQARALNTEAPRALAEEAVKLRTPVIHFSTDYVFNGSGTKPWSETDATGPLNVYGATKLAGEQALVATGAPYFIFRTSWVYGVSGTNFLRTILRLAHEREELRIVADQYGAPTWSRDLARLIEHVIASAEETANSQGFTPAEAIRAWQGTYHAAASGETTWFGFAEEFLRLASEAARPSVWPASSPITSAEYPTPARRPCNSRLDSTRLQQQLGFTLPPWQESTAQVMAEVLASIPPA